MLCLSSFCVKAATPHLPPYVRVSRLTGAPGFAPEMNVDVGLENLEGVREGLYAAKNGQRFPSDARPQHRLEPVFSSTGLKLFSPRSALRLIGQISLG